MENHGNPVLPRIADLERVETEPPAFQTMSSLCKPDRLPGACDVAIDLEPARFMVRNQFAHPAPGCIMHAGMPFERRIDLQEPIIDRFSVIVEQHLDDTEAFVHRLHERLVSVLALTEIL